MRTRRVFGIHFMDHQDLVVYVHREIVRVYDESVFRIRMYGQGYLFSGTRVRLVVFNILAKIRVCVSENLERSTYLEDIVHTFAPI